MTAPVWFARVWLPALLSLALGAGSCANAAADTIRVAGGGAVQAAVTPLAQEFSRDTGNFVKAEFAPMGALAKRIEAGEKFDVLIMTPEALAPLDRGGRLLRDSAANLGRVGIGVVVNAQRPSPDISSAAALRQTLLNAKSIVYIDPTLGTSGKYVAEMITRLGISDQLKSKTRLGRGGQVVAPVGTGEIDLGIHQISEVLPVPGVRVVGELPPEFQHYTTYVAVVTEGSRVADPAHDFVRYLAGSHARDVLRLSGFTIP